MNEINNFIFQKDKSLENVNNCKLCDYCLDRACLLKKLDLLQNCSFNYSTAIACPVLEKYIDEYILQYASEEEPHKTVERMDKIKQNEKNARQSLVADQMAKRGFQKASELSMVQNTAKKSKITSDIRTYMQKSIINAAKENIPPSEAESIESKIYESCGDSISSYKSRMASLILKTKKENSKS